MYLGNGDKANLNNFKFCPHKGITTVICIFHGKIQPLKSAREEKMILKLINEVRDQSNLRIQQQQKLGEQDEKVRNLQQNVEKLQLENTNLKDEIKRYKDLMVSNLVQNFK